MTLGVNSPASRAVRQRRMHSSGASRDRKRQQRERDRQQQQGGSVGSYFESSSGRRRRDSPAAATAVTPNAGPPRRVASQPTTSNVASASPSAPVRGRCGSSPRAAACCARSAAAAAHEGRVILEDAAVERLAVRDEPGGVQVLELVLVQDAARRVLDLEDHRQAMVSAPSPIQICGMRWLAVAGSPGEARFRPARLVQDPDCLPSAAARPRGSSRDSIRSARSEQRPARSRFACASASPGAIASASSKARSAASRFAQFEQRPSELDANEGVVGLERCGLGVVVAGLAEGRRLHRESAEFVSAPPPTRDRPGRAARELRLGAIRRPSASSDRPSPRRDSTSSGCTSTARPK